MMAMQCPDCKTDMKMMSREVEISPMRCVTYYACERCQVGIETIWIKFSLEEVEWQQ